MSKFIKDLIETIENEFDPFSPYASLDNVEDEIIKLINTIKHQQCKHCQLNIKTDIAD